MADNSLVLRPRYSLARRQRQQRETITIRNAQVLFRNFAGKKGMYNDEGERGFSVELDEGLAADLEQKGWNIKPLKKFDEDDEQMYQLPIAVSFKIRPPRIYMVTGDGDRMPLRKTLLPEDMLFMMDNLDLTDANMVVAASYYDVGGRKGKKAYLQSFFGHVFMDELEQEYADVEDMMVDDAEKHCDEDNTIEGEFEVIG